MKPSDPSKFKILQEADAEFREHFRKTEDAAIVKQPGVWQFISQFQIFKDSDPAENEFGSTIYVNFDRRHQMINRIALPTVSVASDEVVAAIDATIEHEIGVKRREYFRIGDAKALTRVLAPQTRKFTIECRGPPINISDIVTYTGRLGIQESSAGESTVDVNLACFGDACKAVFRTNHSRGIVELNGLYDIHMRKACAWAKFTAWPHCENPEAM